MLTRNQLNQRLYLCSMKKVKLPTDPNKKAKMIVDIATGNSGKKEAQKKKATNKKTKK